MGKKGWKSRLWNFIKSFVKSFIISGFVTLIALASLTVVEFFVDRIDAREKELKPYYPDIVDEIIKIEYSYYARGILKERLFFSYDNFILQYLKEGELKNLEIVKSKLPQDDFMVDSLYYMIEKQLYVREGYHSQEFDRELINFLGKIYNKKTAHWRTADADKSLVISHIIGHILESGLRQDERVLDFIENICLRLANTDDPELQVGDYGRFVLRLNLLSVMYHRYDYIRKLLLDDERICISNSYNKFKMQFAELLKSYSAIDYTKYINKDDRKMLDFFAGDVKTLAEIIEKFEKNVCNNFKNKKFQEFNPVIKIGGMEFSNHKKRAEK